MHTTSDRLDTWLILFGTTGSGQYHESTLVWRNVPLYHLLKCLFPLCHALFVEKGKTKYQKQCSKDTLRQTMVDSSYCLVWFVPEGMNQVSRWLEVAYIDSLLSTPGYLLALHKWPCHERDLTQTFVGGWFSKGLELFNENVGFFALLSSGHGPLLGYTWVYDRSHHASVIATTRQGRQQPRFTSRMTSSTRADIA